MTAVQSSTFLKAVGAVAAVVSLLLGLNQITGVVQQLRVHHKEFAEAMASGEQESRRGDHAAAFRSFRHAAELDPVDREAQARETQAAMLWLETVHAQDHTFTEVANQLLPVLDNALAKARGPVAGDIIAHIAWANFLRYREGQREGIDIDDNLKAAFAADTNNVYAHAMSGFWILWQRGDLQSAKSHFSAALATGRVRPYVRGLQLSALTNHDSPEADAEALRVANEMRKSGETIDASHRERIFWSNFSSRLHSRDGLVASLSVLSPQDTEATYDWLDDRPADEVKRSSRAFVEANLSEIQGRRAEALAQYQALQKQLRHTSIAIASAVDSSVERLSHSH
jgi:tetratricopeptide (TPR) repeat protein